jgi:hypothetical protein
MDINYKKWETYIDFRKVESTVSFDYTIVLQIIYIRGGQPTARGHFFALGAISKCP